MQGLPFKDLLPLSGGLIREHVEQSNINYLRLRCPRVFVTPSPAEVITLRPFSPDPIIVPSLTCRCIPHKTKIGDARY